MSYDRETYEKMKAIESRLVALESFTSAKGVRDTTISIDSAPPRGARFETNKKGVRVTIYERAPRGNRKQRRSER